LHTAIDHHGDCERREFAIGFGYVHSACRFGCPEWLMGKRIEHSASGGWCFQQESLQCSLRD
jgi:hypothetical protein